MPLPVIPIEPPYLPELLPEVVEYVEGILPDGAHVFEFGSGHSTVWFAEMGCHVATVEHEPEWADEVERALGEAGLMHRVEMILVEDDSDIPYQIDFHGKFDAVFVDCLSTRRKDAIHHAIIHVKLGGYLIADDSHWRGVASALQVLDDQGLSCTVLRGMHTRKTGKVRHHQTSIYRRPDDSGGVEET